MDRYDEAKEILPPEGGSHDEVLPPEGGSHEDTEPRDMRAGEVLGLGGAPVPKQPGDPTASNDPESVAQRRHRMAEDDSFARRQGSDQHAGATGMDMGAGGQGTDISGD